MSRRNGGGAYVRASWVWVAVWSAVAVVAYLRAGAETHHLENSLAAGRDAFGRPLVWLIPSAAAVSMAFATLASVGALVLAASLGALMAVAPLGARFVFERGLDFLLAFPSLLFALGWAAVRGPGWGTLAFALLVGAVPAHVRLVYSRGREVLREDYLLAAVASGADLSRLVARYLFPEMMRIAWIKWPNVFAHALIAEATLTYLGVGAPLGRETWGGLLVQGKDYLLEAPSIAAWTGLPLVATILALMTIADRGKEMPPSQTRRKSVPLPG